MDVLETLEINSWTGPVSKAIQDKAIRALESGKVLFLPNLPFELQKQEQRFLSTKYVDPKSKNISYNTVNDKLGGAICETSDEQLLKEMIKRYSQSSRSLLEHLLPHYTPNLIRARTSYRPVEVEGRVSSYRKDDTRLHVDAFPSNPVKGQRILRVFTNVNPEGMPRVWRLGEPFADVVEKIAPKVSKPIPGLAYLLQLLKITKDYRTKYDHYMLNMHDTMKGDNGYQETVRQKEVKFPPGSTWIVYTDQTSHAAMKGQYLFEQTHYLPVSAMLDENTSPLRVLEKFVGGKLV
jgi:hypothetical protein